MNKILLALAASVLFSSGAFASGEASPTAWYEQSEKACSNFLAAQHYPPSSLVYSYIKRRCMEIAPYSPEFVAEWLPKEEDPLDKMLRACRAGTPDIRACLNFELERIGRQ